MKSAEDKLIFTELKNKAENVLSTQLRPFWMSLRDREFGGYYGRKDFCLNLFKDSDKSVLMHSRILYFFSEYGKISNDLSLISEAENAFRFIMEHCFDEKNGGVYWSVTFDGKPADTTKYTYNHAFAIYALSSYYSLTGDKTSIDAAFKLFRIIEEKCFDGIGYLESFSCEWNAIENEKLSENNVVSPRTMNTLLHIFEAYSSLYKYTDDKDVANAMVRILNIYRNKVFNPQKMRQEVFFDENYSSLIDLQSYGHDIESSWLIDLGCSYLGIEFLADEIYSINSILAERIYNCAYINGSVVNEVEYGVVDTDRIWWVQCESVIGFLNQWEKTGETKYFRAANCVWEFIQSQIVDKRPESEWFWGVHENGSPMEGIDMAGEWKCPYHNGRMCFEIIRRWKNDT